MTTPSPTRFDGMLADRRKALELLDQEQARADREFAASIAAQLLKLAVNSSDA